MCGISGIINTRQNGFAVKDITAMTDIVQHRGPDDEGFVLFDKEGKYFTAGGAATSQEVYKGNFPYSPQSTIEALAQINYTSALGHRRLSILDLTAYGHCPMSYSDGRYWITYNGEIYNFNELKEELQKLGHHFISHTDTEVILAAYAQWGTACLDRFNGMWAFCIYDTGTKEIFLARDRFGIKPLYYWAAVNGAFCFGSEIKQFTVLPGWKAILNNQKAYDFLVYNVADHTEETMFAGVYQIPAGCYFKATVANIKPDKTGRIKNKKWYRPEYKKYDGTFEEAAKGFKNHFKASVKEHLIADVPVGCALSGGLDSSAIVCEVSELLVEKGKGEVQKTFSYCTGDDRYNEKKWMDEVMAQVKVDANYIFSDGDQVFEHSRDLIWTLDEPNQSQSELATWEVYKAAKDNGINVLISGQGADEYISGYEAFMNFRWVQLLKKLRFKKLNEEIDKNKTHLKLSYAKTYLKLLYFFVPRGVRRYLSRKTSYYKMMTSLVSLENLKSKERHPFDDIPFNTNSIFNIAYKQLLHYPLQKYLHFDDRLSMSNSVEARVPFLDHRLVEFTTRLPADYLDGMGETKKIVKHALKDILPEKIRNRVDKIGFVTAEERWVKETHTQEFRAMIEKAIQNSKGIIKPEALQYFDLVSKSKIAFDYTYWRLISFGIWMELFDVELA